MPPEAAAATPPAKPAATTATPPATQTAGTPGKTATASSPDPGKLSLADQVKPGPAKAKLFSDLDEVLKKNSPAATAAGQEQQNAGAQSPDGDKKPGAEGEDGSPAPGGEEGEQGTDGKSEKGEEGAPEKGATAADGKGKKVSPWKLVDQYKGKVATLEKEVAELKKSGGNPQEKAELLKRIETAETRLKEYEQEIKFVDYSKSEEFKTKYKEPYEEAWKAALTDLKELTIDDPSAPGGQRPVAAQDIMELVNLPLGKAREKADEIFGPFANDVMEHRKEIRKLFEAQSKALETAKKSGEEREKSKMEQSQKERQEFERVVSESWQAAQKEAEEHPKIGPFIKPIEGDDDHNKRLIRGYQIVDEAWAANASAPGLNAEQRSEIVKKQAAVRHRAAAFGVISARLEKANSRIAELEKQLEEFKGSEPEVGTTTTTATAGKPSSAKAGLFSKLDKLATKR